MNRSALTTAVSVLGLLSLAGAQKTPERTTPPSAVSCTAPVMVAHLTEVDEASGLAASRRAGDLLWTHNDSGLPILFGVGTDGRIRARVRVTGARVFDWEDIAAGSCPQGSCLFIADIGDNRHLRPFITVYRVPEPAAGETATRAAEAFHATYPDRPQDAEALVIGPTGALFVITKGEGSPVSVYRFPLPLRAGQTVRLERLGTLGQSKLKTRRVTAADATWDGRWVALRTLTAVEFYRASDLLAGTSGTPGAIDVSSLREPQGEGLAFARDGTIFLAGEGTRGGTLARLSCKLP